MTESQWLTCTDPTQMLEWLRTSGKPADRKLFLFAVACCQRVPHPSERRHILLDFTERYAEGLDTLEAAPYDEECDYDDIPWLCVETANDAALHGANWSATEVRASFWRAATGSGIIADENADKARQAEHQSQAHLLRCIFGSPFRSMPTVPDYGRNPTVLALATAIYGERAWDRLPVLADSLEEAGTTDPDILNHCRQPGVHARGCWVVDLVLGKQ
jgi:hypothetical protein